MRFKPQSYEKYSDKFLHEFKIVLIFPVPAIAPAIETSPLEILLCQSLLVAVMSFERYHIDNYFVIFDTVNHSVAFVDFSAPVP